MELIKREKWGARPPRNASQLVRKGFVKLHWTVTCVSPGASVEDECKHMRKSLQDFHMDTRGWSDVAYNFVVFPSGRVYEGRGLNVRSAANGGGATNYLHQAVALVAGPDCAAQPRQYEAVASLINTFYRNGVRGHRDGHSTDCPGDDVYQWIQDCGWADALADKGPSYWSWRAWRLGLGPWEGLGRRAQGKRFRPKIPPPYSPKWPNWWSRLARSQSRKESV